MTSESKIQVLLIEDNEADAALIEEILSDAGTGFSIDRASSLEQGLEMAVEQPSAVALLDLSLPDSYGMETLSNFQARAPQVPVVILTGNDDEAVAVEALKSGAQDYLVKGKADGDMMARAIRYAIGRKDAETRLLKAEEKIRQAQKMDALALFAGGVAHDFNNALAAIMGYADLMLSELPKTDRNRGNLEEILSAANRAAQMTNQLMAFLSRRELRTELVTLQELVRGLERQIRKRVGAHIELKLELDEGGGMVLIDREQMEQIIMILVENAREAMPQSGELTIQVIERELTPEELETYPSLTPGSRVVFSVRDTGTGIPPDVRERVFEPFFTTKRFGKNSGLSLATVFGIVEQFEGVIGLQSEEGVGTEFTMYLKPGLFAKPSSPKPKQTGAGRGGETILVVEDEEQIRYILKGILESSGYTVLLVHHPDLALDLMKSHPGRIDLVISDVIMPYLYGPELVERLREMQADLKVIYMSGYTESALSNKKIELGEATLLQKPFLRKPLLEAVRTTLDQAQSS